MSDKELFAMIMDLFADDLISATRWYNTPNKALENLTPRELEEMGEVNKVKRLINRLENGIFV